MAISFFGRQKLGAFLLRFFGGILCKLSSPQITPNPLRIQLGIEEKPTFVVRGWLKEVESGPAQPEVEEASGSKYGPTNFGALLGRKR
jgi:hypothetical protein